MEVGEAKSPGERGATGVTEANGVTGPNEGWVRGIKMSTVVRTITLTVVIIIPHKTSQIAKPATITAPLLVTEETSLALPEASSQAAAAAAAGRKPSRSNKRVLTSVVIIDSSHNMVVVSINIFRLLIWRTAGTYRFVCLLYLLFGVDYYYWPSVKGSY